MGNDSNIQIKKNTKLKNLLTEEQINAEKIKEEKNKLIGENQQKNEIPLNLPEANNQLKSLLEGKPIEIKKDVSTTGNPLKKKFKINVDDLPSL